MKNLHEQIKKTLSESFVQDNIEEIFEQAVEYTMLDTMSEWYPMDRLDDEDFSYYTSLFNLHSSGSYLVPSLEDKVEREVQFYVDDLNEDFFEKEEVYSVLDSKDDINYDTLYEIDSVLADDYDEELRNAMVEDYVTVSFGYDLGSDDELTVTVDIDYLDKKSKTVQLDDEEEFYNVEKVEILIDDILKQFG